jgi:uncharacterized membrane protein YebE (DUF533 family)
MIGFFEYQYLKFKKSHLQNLVALAKADGHFHEQEKEFLYKMGIKYQLKPKQVENILASEEPVALLMPDTFHQKVALLYDTVGMMMADGVIDEREMTFCRRMFRRFGFKDGLIQDMIEAYQKGNLDDLEAWEAYVEHTRNFLLESKQPG